MYISVILFSDRIMCQFSRLTTVSRRSYLFGNVHLLSTQIRKACSYKTGNQMPQRQRTTNSTMNQKEEKNNYDLQNTSQKTKDWAARTSLKTGGELRWSDLNQYHTHVLFERVINVWSFITKYLRFLCKFTSWSGETSTGNFSNVFFFILDKNNERPDWMTDLKHTDSAW
jgi:hypothetical protein